MGRIQTARLDNFIRRWGSIKGAGSVLSETLGDVFPVLDLENLTPENQLPAGWRSFWGFITVAGVAAQLQGASLINPANSGNIVVVDQILVRTSAIENVTIGNSLPLFTLAAGTTSRDTRAPGAVGDVRIGANANVGAAETGLLLRPVAGTVDFLAFPNGVSVLAPGTQLAAVGATVNINIHIGFTGRVRVAEPSELSF